MCPKLVTIRKSFIVNDTGDVDITTNLSQYIDINEIIEEVVGCDDLSEVFEATIDDISEDDLVCKFCGEFISPQELEDNSDLVCNKCAEELLDGEPTA